MSTYETLFGKNAPDEYDLRVANIVQPTQLDPRKYTTGLAGLDEQMKPFRPGEFVGVGAREGMGKTALLETTALANSLQERVMFCELEMPRELIQDRCLAKLMNVGLDMVSIERSQKSEAFRYAMERLEQRDLLIWGPRAEKLRTLDAILQRAEDVTAAVLIVDYTRMIHDWEPGKPAQRLINRFADWAHDRNVLTVLLTQLRDEAVGVRPHNGHIQDTTQLAQRADRMLLLFRPKLGKPLEDTFGEVIVTKNRRGPVFRTHIGWTGEVMEYYDLDEAQAARIPCCRQRAGGKPQPSANARIYGEADGNTD